MERMREQRCCVRQHENLKTMFKIRKDKKYSQVEGQLVKPLSYGKMGEDSSFVDRRISA